MGRERAESGRKRAERVDKNKRFTLRIDPDIFHESEAVNFNYGLSLNLLYNRCIKFAIENDEFMRMLHEEYGHKVNPKRGHYVYVRDWRK